MKIGKALRRDKEKQVGKYTTLNHEQRKRDKKRSESIRKLRQQKEEKISSSGL